MLFCCEAQVAEDAWRVHGQNALLLAVREPLSQSPECRTLTPNRNGIIMKSHSAILPLDSSMNFWGIDLPSCQTPNMQPDVVSFFPLEVCFSHVGQLLPKRSTPPTHRTCIDFSGFWNELAPIETCKPLETLRLSSGDPRALPLRKIYPQMSRLWKSIIFLSHLPFRGRIALFIFILVESRAVFKRLILKRVRVRVWFRPVGIFLQLNTLSAVLELRPTPGHWAALLNLKVTSKVMEENHKRESQRKLAKRKKELILLGCVSPSRDQKRTFADISVR